LGKYFVVDDVDGYTKNECNSSSGLAQSKIIEMITLFIIKMFVNYACKISFQQKEALIQLLEIM
jgi:hypothetical protein